jgi:putative SOS response-associated peptidase YedK
MTPMCGRFVQTQSAETYAEYFSVDSIRTDPLPASWNVAPTDSVYAIADYRDERLLGTFEWGLVPWWAKDRKIAAKHINARVETVADKAAFSDSFREKRCIVPADGFYEWEKKKKGKLPHYIYRTTGEPLALAGLWASWKDPETEERHRTCTIITGEPDETVSPLHNRMPVILPESVWDAWLDPSIEDPSTLRNLLGSFDSPALAEHAVSTLVNKVQNNLPDLINPLDTGAVET